MRGSGTVPLSQKNAIPQFSPFSFELPYNDKHGLLLCFLLKRGYQLINKIINCRQREQRLQP